MTAAEISAILGAATTIAGVVEKYGPQVYTDVKDAIEATISKTGPTTAAMDALAAKCAAANAAIQSS
ncbi:hypothetical protein H845_210 [Komagataeibacter xylinus E25]|nr:hypothetical protein H845_210 [Komagataeibacter xylinus E25]